MSHTTFLSLGQGLCCRSGVSQANLLVSVNKVLMEDSLAHLLVYCLTAFLYNHRLE